MDESNQEAENGRTRNTNTNVNTNSSIGSNAEEHFSTLLRLVKAKSPAKAESVQNLIEMLSNNLIDAEMFVSNLESIIYHTD